ncbi:Transcription termination factor MTERF9 chloroplastic [Bienertia sinuspersici]
MAIVHFRRVIFNILQKRFFNAIPSSKLPKKPSPLPNKTTEKSCESSKNKSGIHKSVSLHSFPIQYLTKSCGLSLDYAISASKRVTLDECNREHFDAVVSLLKWHQFSDAQIIELVRKHPSILLCRISSTLEPKFEYLAEIGIKGLNLPKLVMLSPAILFRSLDAQLKPAMSLLKRFVSSPEKILVTIQRGSWFLTSDWKGFQHNIDYLIEQGLPHDRLEELIVLQPRCLHQDIERIKYAFEMIKTMGVKPNDLKFIHALRVILSLSELSWKRKVKIFESLGWSSDEVISTFTSSPHCLSCSEEKLRRGMDYFVNTLKIDREVIIAYPKILMYSIPKRVIPRYTVWKMLEEKKLTKTSKFIWVLNKSDKDFMNKYVTKYSSLIPSIVPTYERLKGDWARSPRRLLQSAK